MKVLEILKHAFVPHDKNDYKPHFFREVWVAVILFGSVFLLCASAGSSFFLHRTILGANIAASVLVDLTNQSRLAFNQSPLSRSSKLNEAAQMKGEDMVRRGYFAHISPDGVTPWYWFKEVGYNFLYAGENLAINFTESEGVEKTTKKANSRLFMGTNIIVGHAYMVVTRTGSSTEMGKIGQSILMIK